MARKGKCSRNPIILILDFLCQRDTPHEPHTLMVYVSAFAFTANLFFFSWFERHNINTTWMWYMPLIPLLFIDQLYRYFRNRYLKKHNLPGPFGTGTIDIFENN